MAARIQKAPPRRKSIPLQHTTQHKLHRFQTKIQKKLHLHPQADIPQHPQQLQPRPLTYGQITKVQIVVSANT